MARKLPQRTWMELRRLAIASDSPKNTASRMLAWMARDVSRRFPEVERLISYQDQDVHQGTIYRAAGWHQAEGYISAKGSWKNRNRKSTDQVVVNRIRWEKILRLPPEL